MKGITVIRRTVTVRKNNNPVHITRRPNLIRVTAQVPVLHRQIFKPFFFVAIEGQTVFTLPSYCIANGMIFLAVNGTGQSPIRGDYSVNGLTLTMGSPLDAGDEVFGTYEEE